MSKAIEGQTIDTRPEDVKRYEALHFRLGELEAALAKQAAPQAAEMGFSLNFKLDGKTVRDVQLTLRAPAHTGADEVMAHFREMFTAHEWHFAEPTRPAPAKPAAPDTSGVDKALETGKAVLPPPATKAPAPAKPAGGPKEVIHFTASKITVTPKEDDKATVEFWGAGRKYADIYCTQKVESLVTLFGGGWTAQHFQSAASYDVKLTVAYTLSDKLNSKNNPYKDLVSITEA